MIVGVNPNEAPIRDVAVEIAHNSTPMLKFG
jgi:hypothetical protein